MSAFVGLTGMGAWLLSTLILATAAAEPERHFAIAAGAGMAYGDFGVHLEARAWHLALFAGGGWDHELQHTVVAAGLRAFTARTHGGFLSLNFGYGVADRPDIYDSPTGPMGREEHVLLGSTIGWRWLWDRIFAEVGVGAKWRRERLHVWTDASQGAGPGCTGTHEIYCDIRGVTADLNAAIGATF